jgi:hypothetical protein
MLKLQKWYATWLAGCVCVLAIVVPTQQVDSGVSDTALAQVDAGTGPDLEQDKRAWSDLQSGWGKRGWQDLQVRTKIKKKKNHNLQYILMISYYYQKVGNDYVLLFIKPRTSVYRPALYHLK